MKELGGRWTKNEECVGGSGWIFLGLFKNEPKSEEEILEGVKFIETRLELEGIKVKREVKNFLA